MNIISKQSFWIMKPKKQPKKSIIDKLSFKTMMQPFEDSILDALAHFRTEGYVEKLKTTITPESLPLNKDDLLKFLCNQITWHT